MVLGARTHGRPALPWLAKFRAKVGADGHKQLSHEHRYGVVGIILSVRAIELMRGRNYWDAMERDIYRPLGIRNILPGATGFSAENMARIGVLLDNHGRYGEWELFSEDTYRATLPTPLKPYFPALDMRYGIGLRDSKYLSPGSYGHAGGCGTQLIVNPRTHTVFAMVRNGRGADTANNSRR